MADPALDLDLDAVPYPRPRSVQIRRNGRVLYLGTTRDPLEAERMRTAARAGDLEARHVRRVGVDDGDEPAAAVDALASLWAARNARVARQGARQLLAAIVAQALEDSVGRSGSPPEQAEARGWVLGGEPGALGLRFAEALELLDLDPGAVREALRGAP
jgi:hypothetical protein